MTALQFNEYINTQNLEGLARLMTEDHSFIDRDGRRHQPRESVVQNWKQFFGMFPQYHNTFTRVESRENLVVMLGHAYWSEQEPYDPAIWTATIVNDRIREWRVYADTAENRITLHLP